MTRPCVIERGARFEGVLAFDADVQIAGELVGVAVGAGRGTLEVAPGGRFEGEAELHTLYIAGEVEGEVRARGKIVVGAGATARGRFAAAALEVHDGGAIDGPIEMTAPVRDG